MRKRGVYLILVVLVVGGVLVAVFAKREREPEYGGKRLSEWVIDLSIHERIGDPVASEAVRSMGTKTIPWLLRWIAYETPTWKTKLYEVVYPKFGMTNPTWEFTDGRQCARADGAMRAFKDLGLGAEPAVPELARLINDPKSEWSSYRAETVLCGLGSAGWPPLMSVLTNRQANAHVRYGAALHVHVFGNDNRPAVSALQDLLTNADSTLRRDAAVLLEGIKWDEMKSGPRHEKVAGNAE